MTDSEIAVPSVQYLNKKGILYELRAFPKSTEKGAANVAKALGFRERQMVKTLIFESDNGESVLIMVGGDQNVVSGLLKKVMGSRNISMCSPEKVKLITGYEIGSIPPFHWQTHQFRSYIDESLMQQDILGVGTGAWGLEILIKPEHLVQASNSFIVNLTDREKPVFL
jgi:Cys-tRNA(Pro)/Cys-tRNA(Cys) deacylase